VALLAAAVLGVEAAYGVGAFVGFRQLRRNGLGRPSFDQDEGADGGQSDDDDGDGGDGDVVPWRRSVCLAQGAAFQWALHAMVLLFLWFQYAQHQRLVQREAANEVPRASFYFYFETHT
jgi:hypothetical protein